MAMPSLREAGGAVIAEAISHHRPLICADSFGASLVLDPKTAILLPPGSGSSEYSRALLGVTNDLLDVFCFDEIENELLWQNKFKTYGTLYKRLLAV